MAPSVTVSYVLPLKSDAPANDLDGYLASLACVVELIVVDGSPGDVFEDNTRRWRDLPLATSRWI